MQKDTLVPIIISGGEGIAANAHAIYESDMYLIIKANEIFDHDDIACVDIDEDFEDDGDHGKWRIIAISETEDGTKCALRWHAHWASDLFDGVIAGQGGPWNIVELDIVYSQDGKEYPQEASYTMMAYALPDNERQALPEGISDDDVYASLFEEIQIDFMREIGIDY